MIKKIINKSSRIRIDFFLSTKIDKLSRSQIQNYISQGLITINSKPCKKNSQILEIGDKIAIQVPNKDTIQPDLDMQLDILFEDQGFLAINKPAGLLVHPTNTQKQHTVVNFILHNYPKIKIGEKDRPGIVHRLDQDTSGILLIAKNQRSYATLQKMFQDHSIQKTYLAVVFGKPHESSMLISTRQKRSAKNPTKNIIVYTAEGKNAETNMRVLKNFKLKNQDLAVLELQPKTGRMHQLRLQLAHINLPILGDTKYGNKPSKKFSEKLDIKRQLLHAQKIEFTFNGKAYKISAPVPTDIKKYL